MVISLVLEVIGLVLEVMGLVLEVMGYRIKYRNLTNEGLKLSQLRKTNFNFSIDYHGCFVTAAHS